MSMLTTNALATGKFEVKSHVPEHALKKHQVLFMSMLRHDFPSLFSVAIVFLRIVRQDYPSLFAIVCNYFTLAI